MKHFPQSVFCLLPLPKRKAISITRLGRPIAPTIPAGHARCRPKLQRLATTGLDHGRTHLPSARGPESPLEKATYLHALAFKKTLRAAHMKSTGDQQHPRLTGRQQSAYGCSLLDGVEHRRGAGHGRLGNPQLGSFG